MSPNKNNKRILLIVLDSVGIGALPDAAEYGDQGANTLQHVAAAVDGLQAPHLEALGLGNLGEFPGLNPDRCVHGAFGRLAEKSKGKDTITGHWEMAGIIVEKPFQTFPQGFPATLMNAFETEIQTGTLANIPASGTEIIKELGPQHLKTGYPIVYTSADSVFQIAAHEDIVPLEKLYHYCQVARRLCSEEYQVARVIARPFKGAPGSFYRTENRKDFAVPPTARSVLEDLSDNGYPVVGIGKIKDIFVGKGITHSFHTGSNEEGMTTTLQALEQFPSGLIFVNLVDFDMKFGHRLDAVGYARALEAFDQWLPQAYSTLKPDDILIITADHGCDPTTPGTDHSREYVPLLTWTPHLNQCRTLGTRKTFADIAQTSADYLLPHSRQFGTSFLADIL